MIVRSYKAISFGKQTVHTTELSLASRLFINEYFGFVLVLCLMIKLNFSDVGLIVSRMSIQFDRGIVN